MKGRVVILAVVAFLLLTTSGLAQSGRGYSVEGGMAAGGGYRLMSFAPLAENVAVGGAYRLLGLSVPALQGSGCCCTYLPCLMRNK